MSSLKVYDLTGKEVGKQNVSDVLFKATVNQDLLHRAVVRRLSNGRMNVAHVQNRGDVTATRKKAFKQKGTGNARRGSLTTNLLRGGGGSHVPRNVQNFVKNMPASERRQAIYSSISARTDVSVVLKAELEVPKTRDFAGFLKQMEHGKKFLFVLSHPSEKVIVKSVRNLPNARFVYAQYVNAVDYLWSDAVIYVNNAVEEIERLFSSKKS